MSKGDLEYISEETAIMLYKERGYDLPVGDRERRSY